MLGMTAAPRWFPSSSCSCRDVYTEDIRTSVHDAPRAPESVEGSLLALSLKTLLEPRAKGAVWCDELWFDEFEGDELGPEDDKVARRETPSDSKRYSLKVQFQGEWLLMASDLDLWRFALSDLEMQRINSIQRP